MRLRLPERLSSSITCSVVRVLVNSVLSTAPRPPSTRGDRWEERNRRGEPTPSILMVTESREPVSKWGRGPPASHRVVTSKLKRQSRTSADRSRRSPRATAESAKGNRTGGPCCPAAFVPHTTKPLSAKSGLASPLGTRTGATTAHQRLGVWRLRSSLASMRMEGFLSLEFGTSRARMVRAPERPAGWATAHFPTRSRVTVGVRVAEPVLSPHSPCTDG